MEKGRKSSGTTKKGIEPTYASKATKNGLRLVDLLGNFNTFKEKLVQFEICLNTFMSFCNNLVIDKLKFNNPLRS